MLTNVHLTLQYTFTHSNVAVWHLICHYLESEAVKQHIKHHTIIIFHYIIFLFVDICITDPTVFPYQLSWVFSSEAVCCSNPFVRKCFLLVLLLWCFTAVYILMLYNRLFYLFKFYLLFLLKKSLLFPPLTFPPFSVTFRIISFNPNFWRFIINLASNISCNAGVQVIWPQEVQCDASPTRTLCPLQAGRFKLNVCF